MIRVKYLFALLIVLFVASTLFAIPCKHAKSQLSGNYYLNTQTVHQRTWWSENSGTMIGSAFGALLAGLVAIMTVNLSHKKNIRIQKEGFRNRKKEEDRIYCGYLYAIFHEVSWHLNLTGRLMDELQTVKDHAIRTLELLNQEAHEKYRLNYLDSCRTNILTFARFENGLLAYIATYMNLIMTINQNLDFRPVLRLKSEHKSDQDYRDSLVTYFEELIALIIKAEKAMTGIQEAIIEELKSYPENHVELSMSGKPREGSNRQSV